MTVSGDKNVITHRSILAARVQFFAATEKTLTLTTLSKSAPMSSMNPTFESITFIFTSQQRMEQKLFLALGVKFGSH